MKEQGFSLHHQARNIKIKGGNLWKSKKREGEEGMIDTKAAILRLYVSPQDSLDTVREQLLTVVRQHSWVYYFRFTFSRRLPSLLYILPAMVTVLVFAFFTVWGDLVIDWVFMNPDEGTIFGPNRRISLILYAVVAVIILGFFPFFFTGDHGGVTEAIGERFSGKRLLKQQFKRILEFLRKRGYQELEIWNPFSNELEQSWIRDSFIPATIESKIGLSLQVKIDERNLAQHYILKVTKEVDIEWEESYFTHKIENMHPIRAEYLEEWEKRLLAIYVFSSTANMPQSWKILKGTESDGVINNAVSLKLADFIVKRFKERLFSEEDRKQLISTDAFASRCVNDFGILTPCLRYTNEVWAIDKTVVDAELNDIQEEIRYVYSFLQANIGLLTQQLKDPVAALVLNSVHVNNSIYNQDRLTAIRFFIQVVNDSEQYKILKQYWNVVVDNPIGKDNLNEDIYRIIGVDILIELATVFEKAAMYEQAIEAANYIEMVYPYKGKMNRARVAERQGNFIASMEAMLEIQQQFKNNEIELDKSTVVNLNLNMGWAIVSGRLEQYRNLCAKLLEEAKWLLYADYDKIRDSEQIIRLHNVKANYEEWQGNPNAALENYNKALQIPGITEVQLSNLLVNKGIALRLQGELVEAAHHGRQGAEIKVAIGDADQAPIALHNLAQTMLMLAFKVNDNKERLELFEQAADYAKIGLNLQKQTGSIKKRGQLLVEYFMGVYRAAKLNSLEIQKAWDNVIRWLSIENNEGRAESYDNKVIVQELMVLLTGDSSMTLEETIAWKPQLELKNRG